MLNLHALPLKPTKPSLESMARTVDGTTTVDTLWDAYTDAKDKYYTDDKQYRECLAIRYRDIVAHCQMAPIDKLARLVATLVAHKDDNYIQELLK